VLDAVQDVARFRDEGFSHVLLTDIADCFPTLRVEQLRRILSVLVADAELQGTAPVLDFLSQEQRAELGSSLKLSSTPVSRSPPETKLSFVP
jgi:hypothetical protein